MYHYVNRGAPELPHRRYLHVDDFRRQLAHLTRDHVFIPQEAFLDVVSGERPCDGAVVLTFDDGLRDHYEFVLPELRRRGLWGIFYIPTGIYQRTKALNVHRVHHLLGRYGGVAMCEALRRLMTDDMLSDPHVSAFARLTYVGQDDDAATVEFKRVLNYFVLPQCQEAVLDELMLECGESDEDLAARLYVTPAMLVEMQREGMLIGSHGVTHRVLSTLPLDEQMAEVHHSFRFLDAITGGLRLRTFCYPYGGFHTFTAQTERLLTECGCVCAFNVEPRDIVAADLRVRPQALPRFDCNALPHGRARRDAASARAHGATI
jgi:peptidoglycan/xylan/chitin deacetylase (PgdA/CDA1 family)